MATFSWICSACICRALPFYNDIVVDEPYFEENGCQSPGISFSEENETLLQSVFQKHEDKLKIAHLNVRSLLPKIDLVSITLQQSSLDILVVTETWLNSGMDNSTFKIPGYTFTRLDRKFKNGGGIAVY